LTDPLDPRRNAYRDDLAEEALRGEVEAVNFVTGTSMQVAVPAAPLRRDPRPSGGIDTEALYGERVALFDERDGWAWVKLAEDGYVGYLRRDVLTEPGPAATHRVRVLRTYVYPERDIKVPPSGLISIASQLAIAEKQGPFAAIAGGGFVMADHLRKIDKHAGDFVSVAKRFLRTPYLWGGKTSLGLDCSALVQLSMLSAGLACPRDSDMQAREVGEAIDIAAGLPALRRGDLVFWKGHVGIMQNADTLIHANAHAMMVTREPVGEAIARIAALGGGKVTAVRRPARLGA
jgi:hypothetical protein